MSRILSGASSVRRAVVVLLALGASIVSSASQPSRDPAAIELRVGFARPGGGYTVMTMPLETYVARVLAGEALRDSDPAALQALAITVRTFALANLGRHRADGFDMCDQTHCQVVREATVSTERAAAATAGRVLMHGDVPAQVFYTASCGGRSELPSAVWPGAEDPPYLPSRADDACGGAPAWTANLAAADLTRSLHAGGFTGARLRNIAIAARDSSGRVAKLRLDGLTPPEISGQDLRVAVGRTLGWQHIKSTAFDLVRDGDRYRFVGHGSGHGVGLCVIGSAKLAAAGESPARILARYFPGLEIRTFAGPPVVVAARSGARTKSSDVSRPAAIAVKSAAASLPRAIDLSLPDDDEGERGAVAVLAERARVEVARQLGLPPPRKLVLRFHPTTASYERATGSPWFTAGALVNGELHLLPLAVLRDRGILERTIRREVVHTVADSALANRPAWVREGAAAYFASLDAGSAPPPRPAVQRQTSCPADPELLRPVSPGALSNALTRAESCFARQIARGKAWREVH